MKAKILFIHAIAVMICLSSCKKEAGPTGATGAQGASGPVLTGNLKGYINHYDASGAKLVSGLAGDSVSIDGTTNAAVTDAAGAYGFAGLSTGVYNLTVTRTGFGTTKIQSVQFTGGGDLYRNANISKIPTLNLSSFMIYDTIINGVNNIHVRGHVNYSNDAQSVILFVGIPGNTTVNSGVSNEISSYVINVAATYTNTGNATLVKLSVPTSELYDLGYASGNTLYVAAYTVGGNTNASSYVDLATNKPIYTALGSTPLFANAPVQ